MECWNSTGCSLQMAELTLREMLENQPLQFEIALQGQHKMYKFQVSECVCVCVCVCVHCVCVHVLVSHRPPLSTQACSSEIRDMWAKEVRRLLQAQFTLMKGLSDNH